MKEDKKDKKPWYEKLNIWIGIIVSICSILGIRVFKDGFIIESEINIYSLFSQEESNQQDGVLDDTQQLKNDETENDSIKNRKEKNIEYVASKNTNSEPEEQVLIDVNTEVRNIQEKYKSLPEPNNLPDPTSDQPINKCYDDNNMKIIKVYCGYDDTNYSRMYYYENDQIYFAFIYFKGEEEHRLYFKDNSLIRYKDENGIIYDVDKEDIVCGWTKFALEDSYKVLNKVEK